MEYIILIHEKVKPHFIIDKCSKELVKKNLIERGFPFIKEIKFIIDLKTEEGILLSFNTEITLSANNYLKYIKNTPFKYYSAEFDELIKAINKSFSKGDRGNYCKLVSSDYAFCVSNEMLFTIHDYGIKEERALGIVRPYEETDENTELNW